MSDVISTAAVLVIGDEILSGRTKDKNVGYIADRMTDLGIDLKEVRIVADEKAAIIEAVRALAERYTIVLTTGGTTSPPNPSPRRSASRRPSTIGRWRS